MIEGKKTHRLVKQPSLNLRYLADYMAASEQARRGIIQSSKFRSTARMIQHIEAKLTIARYIRSGASDPALLLEKADGIRNKLAVDQFDEDVNKHNADYLKRFAQVQGDIELPKAEIQQAGSPIDIDINGVTVRFDPPLALTRTTKTNKARCGALMLRYQKGKALPETTACHQSSAILGVLRMIHDTDSEEPEAALCLTLDAYTGKAHPAPTNAVYLFNQIKAACQSIAERWAAIPPPNNAVY